MSAEPPEDVGRVLDPSFASDLGALELAELRARRDAAREEEAVLSFVRRWLHGKLDILRSELVRRRDGASGPDDVVGRLSSVLGEGAGGHSRGVRAGMPTERAQRRARERIERLVSQDHLARLPDLDDGEIERLVERLMTEEQRVSEQRRLVHTVIDSLTAELSERYRAGTASVEDLLVDRQ